MENPDNWVILKMDTPKDGIIYKVLAGWSGGYLDGDSWKMNSGITKVEEEGDFYLFHGHSGSIYKCPKESETLRMNNAYIYEKLKKLHGDKVEIIPVEEMENSDELSCTQTMGSLSKDVNTKCEF